LFLFSDSELPEVKMMEGRRIMNNGVRRWLLLAWLSCAPVSAQLHLITGSPTPKHNERFASALFRVNAATVQLVEELVPQSVGTDWIAISYDLKKAVLLPLAFTASDWKSPILVLDMSTGKVAKRCSFDAPANLSLVGQWLGRLPLRGPVVELVMSDLKTTKIYTMSLDVGTTCENSFAAGVASDAKFALAHGSAGVADLAQADGLFGGIDAQGRVLTVVLGTLVPFDYTIPTELRSAITPYAWGIEVNTSQLMVVTMVEEDRQTYRMFVLNKADQSWSILPAVSASIPPLRAFEHYLAFPISQPSKGREGRSAGEKGWRKGASRMGPDLDLRFRGMKRDYTGQLCLYDAAKRTIRTIVTNQADSEILLVKSGRVYYRIGDRLYQAAIGEAEIGRPTLLATADAIRDAHWAFIVEGKPKENRK
jgi:hypothetical protein